jgi:16S rRNA (cytosine967-C5)-methyltransferase
LSKHATSILNNYVNSVAALNLIINKGKHIDEAINQVKQPSPHLRAIVSGVIRHFETLTHWTQSNVKLKPKDQPIAYLIMCAAFQHQYMQNCKRSDLIFQAAEATTKINRAWAKGLVYATLKKLNLSPITEQRNLPAWLNEKITQSHSGPQVENLLNIWSKPPETCCLRIKANSNDEQLAAIIKESAPCQAYPKTNARHAPLSQVTSMCSKAPHLIYIQDCIHQDIIARLPDLQEKSMVLDACAAPGGKSTALLNNQPNIQLLAIDNKGNRMQRLQDNLARYPQAHCLHADACHPEKWWTQVPFDLILCDAPCSGTGTLHKNPEVKIQQTPENIKKLCTQQIKLLKTLWPMVKAGGYLLYSTCSILKEENQEIIASFVTGLTSPTQVTHHHYMPDGVHGGGYFAFIQKLS